MGFNDGARALASSLGHTCLVTSGPELVNESNKKDISRATGGEKAGGSGEDHTFQVRLFLKARQSFYLTSIEFGPI